LRQVTSLSIHTNQILEVSLATYDILVTIHYWKRRELTLCNVVVAYFLHNAVAYRWTRTPLAVAVDTHSDGTLDPYAYSGLTAKFEDPIPTPSRCRSSVFLSLSAPRSPLSVIRARSSRSTDRAQPEPPLSGSNRGVGLLRCRGGLRIKKNVATALPLPLTTRA
jgi:hypothetical protein